MQLPPLLERECRLLALRLKAPASLRKSAYVAVIGTSFVLFLDSIFRFRHPGEFIFLALFVPTTILLLSSGAGVSSALTEHRRNQMIGLLFLTYARPRDFFLAQIGARIAVAFYFALALLPCFATSLLYGGINWQRCVAAALFIVLEVIFLVAFEFVGAALTADPGLAGLISNITRGVLVFWPWVIDRVTQILSGRPVTQWIYLLSPLQAGLQVFHGFSHQGAFRDFLINCVLVSGFSLAALLVSGWILTHTWREEDHPLKQFRPIRRLLDHFTRARRNWAGRLRPELERNPLVWHAAFDQRSVYTAWATLIVLFFLWLTGLTAWGKAWAVPGIFYLAAAAFIYGVRLQMLLRIATRFSEARQNSYFDFLLASGHAPEEIVSAETRGLYLQFNAIAWTVRAITLAFMIAPLFTRSWNRFALIEHLGISGLLLWFSALRPRFAISQTMWISINTGLGVSAVFRKSSFPLANFAFQFYRIISKGLAGLSRFPKGAEMETVMVLGGALIGWAIIIAINSDTSRRAKLIANFRDIVQAPIRSAAELAKWDTKSALK